MRNISSYKEKIKKYSVISFDMYDTLVRRNVAEPNDVFTIVELLYNKNILEEGKKITGFKERRIHAYRNAYDKRKAACSIDDIYDELLGYDENIKDVLKRLEIEVEGKICVPNYWVLELFEYAKSIGKRIVIVSDMYLPSNVLENILKTCNITGYERLFLSCNYKKSKTDGRLYDVCCEELKAKPREILHFGDGLKNDVIRALQKGIHTIKINNDIKLDYDDSRDLNEIEKFNYSIQQAFISNHINEISDETSKLGFSVLGPLVVGFCTWLHDEIQSKSIDKVFFLAREGLLFKSIYEVLYPNDQTVKKYLYVSRKSLVAPTYWILPEYENVIKSIAKSKEIDVATLLKRWGLIPEDCKSTAEHVGLSLSTVLDGQHLIDDERVKELYETLKDKVIEQSKQKYILLKGYLSQEEFGGKCVIVDIGWNGGMHNAFEKIASIWNIPTEIHGYYIGINTTNLGVKLHNINGFIYDEKYHLDNRYYIYSFAGPLELSLTAAHDTTVGYQNVHGNFEPVFGSGEYINDDNTLKPELLYITRVQEGIIQYAKKWKKESLDIFCNIVSEAAFRNCRLFGLSPKQKHIKLFYEFGANDLGVEQHFVNPKYKKLYGTNNVFRGFWTSTWKSGYMKMIFRLPLPYYKLYMYMRKRVN